MTIALQFLERILPEDGYKCATVFHDGKVWNKFFPTIEELARFISVQDGLGRTVYHACAAFGTPDSRKQSNAIGARSFWLDVDAGEGKPYADAVEAALAIQQFMQRVLGLPSRYTWDRVTVSISIGHFEKLWSPNDWQRYVAGLAALCHRADLQVDRVRTKDLASVLRTPGTHHRKKLEPKLVRVGDLTGPYDLSLFDCFLEGESNDGIQALRAGNARIPRSLPRAGSAVAGAVPSIISAAANIYADEPNYTEPVVRGCSASCEAGTIAWSIARATLVRCARSSRIVPGWRALRPLLVQRIRRLHPRRNSVSPRSLSRIRTNHLRQVRIAQSIRMYRMQISRKAY